MATRIDRVDTRKGLKPRRSPYWQRVAKGRHIGFRRISRSMPGTWLARYFNGGEYPQQPLGDFADLPEGDRFDAAKQAAEAWWKHLDMGGTTDAVAVKAACASYVDKIKLEKSEAAAKDAESRFRRLVDSDPIGKVLLAKLTARHVADWKKRTLERGGTRGSYNRNATALRAALNLAHERREVASDHAWSVELKPFGDADGRRELYLTMAERRKLIAKASAEAQPLLTAMALLPVRPGELAGLHVHDLNVRQGVLHVSGKSGARDLPLPKQAFQHFKTAAKDKQPGAWLIARADGKQWDRFAWRDAINDAIVAGKLPKATCAYTLRHSAITDLVTDGLDLFTVAKISGTSIAMIEKHYGKLRQEIARTAMEKLSL